MRRVAPALRRRGHLALMTRPCLKAAGGGLSRPRGEPR
jgi:hypothetical protein